MARVSGSKSNIHMLALFEPVPMEEICRASGKANYVFGIERKGLSVQQELELI